MSETVASRGRRSRRGTAHSSFYRSTQEQSRALYHCNYCHKDISDNVRIKCADCPDFDLCVECFSVGVEVNGHRNSHSYRVMDNLSFPIFHPTWGSDEELLLLEAVDMYGPGNWAAVAEHVGTKSKEACQHHYFQIYIYPASCPLPTPAPEMAGLDVRELAAVARSNCGRKRMRLDPAALQQQSKQQQQQLQPASQTQQAANGPQQRLQVKQEGGTDASKPATAAVSEQAATAAAAGAETETVKQEKEQQQHDQEQQPQSQQLEEVHGKGAKRRRDSEVSAAAAAAAAAEQQTAAHPVSGGLSQPHPQQAGKHPSDQKQAGAAASEAAAAAASGGGGGAVAAGVGLGPVGLGPAAAGAAGAAAAGAADHPRVRGSGPQLDMMTGWHSKRFEFEPEWDSDAEVSIAELEFKETDTPEDMQAKLRLLEIYNKRLDERARRQAFILEHGLLNVRKMQGLDRRRMAGERERYAQMRVFARYQPPGSHEGLVEGLLVEGRLRMRIAELQAHRAAGRRTMAEIEEADMEAAVEAKRKSSKGQGAADEGGPGPGGSSGLGGYRSTASALNVWRQRRGVGLDISGLPGVERLTAREAELCAHARLLPAHYLSLKDVMMRDAEVHGHISRNDARGFFRLDPARSARVWELLCSAGWLRGNNPEEAEDKRRWARGGGGKKSEAVAAAATAAAVEGAGDEDAGGAAAAAAAAPSEVTTDEGPYESAAQGKGEEVEELRGGDAVLEQGVEAEAAAAVGAGR